MKFEFGWGAWIATTLALASGIVLVRGALADRERERQGVARCASQCRIAGLCGFDAKAGVCRPRTGSDCAQSDVCKANGLCSLDGGQCVVTSDDECRNAEQCKESGRCKFAPDAPIACVPGGEEDCRNATICRRFGRCTLQGSACQVGSNEDCARSEPCSRNGHCSMRRVEVADGVVTVCAALSNEDCARGEDCKTRNTCTAVDGECR